MQIQNNIKQKLSHTDSIQVIHKMIHDHPGSSRTEISRLVCEHFGFYNTKNKVQQSGCLKALRELEKPEHFSLPKPRSISRNKVAIKRLEQAVPLPVNVPSKAGKTLGLQLIQVGSPEQMAIWNELMIREHPRKTTTMAGAQLRYLIDSEHGWLGGFGFSASALRLRNREAWIGWDDDARKNQLHRIINLSRFLIRPSVQCRNLASHCMGLVLRRIADDFEAVYHYRPWLVESFVDLEQHTGVVYEASNWLKIGQTQGRGRNGGSSKNSPESIKGIYMYPLIPDFRHQLGGAEPPPPPSLEIGEGMENNLWAENEFGGANLGDLRLSNRLVKSAKIQAKKPGCSFSGAAKGQSKNVDGYYRMIEQPATSAVTLDAILAPHREQTIKRMRGQKTVLCIQDGTNLNYSSLAQCSGLGLIGSNQTKATSKGFHLHSTFVVSTDGIPLGLLRADCEPPKKKNKADKKTVVPIEEKKTFNWIEGLRDANTLAKVLPDTCQIGVLDREGDFYELFEEPRKKNVELLVRASYNRNMGKGEEKLFDQVRLGKERGQLSICVPRQSSRPKLSKQKAREKREERRAEVAVRYQAIQVHPPTTPEHKDKSPISLNIVHIREESPPEGQKAVEWFLLTTLSINSLEDAIECVRWYRLRWRIEDWHRTLKSGCNVEKIAHRTVDRLKRGIAIKMVIAWRIMLMTLLSRECPELPAEVLFSDVEIEVLNGYAKKKVTTSTLSH